MKTVEGRVAVVTGAASGIGRAMAQTFVDAGMKVVLADIDEARLLDTTRAMAAAGGDVIGVVANVTKPEQIQNLADATLKKYGSVHVLCNHVGVSYNAASSWETPPDAWRWVFDVNVMGIANSIHTFVPIMIRQDTECHIVNTASGTGLVVNSINIPYAASKHAVVALTESMHDEMIKRGLKIGVSLLCPGPVNTDIMHSIERFRPESLSAPQVLTEEEAIVRRACEIWLQRCMDPAVVGPMVLEAIRNETFYVITHEFIYGLIQTRLNNIINKTNPEPSNETGEVMAIVKELMDGRIS
jgi:NAD(P)-dependent dehydrogenase (short-subunit alcohol dehydrogenase family)